MIEYDMDRRPSPLELKALLDSEVQPVVQQHPPQHQMHPQLIPAHLAAANAQQQQQQPMQGTPQHELISPSKQKINPFQQIFD